MFKEVITVILVGILTQFILTPILYALHPVYVVFLNQIPIFGGLIIFILDNFGFVVFIAIALYIWKALQRQQQQNIPYYGAG